MSLSGDQPANGHQWWLGEGSEVCSVCEALVHPEMLGYCLLCDQTICYLCCSESTESGTLICPPCAEESRAKERE